MKSIKFLTVAAVLMICGLCSAAVNIPLNDSWRAMRHTKHTKCAVLSDGLELTNPTKERDYAAVSKKITVDLTATPWLVVKIEKVSGHGEIKAVCGKKKMRVLNFNEADTYQINLAELLKVTGEQKVELCCYIFGGGSSVVFSKMELAEEAQKLTPDDAPFYIAPTFVSAAYYFTSDNLGDVTPYFRKFGSEAWNKGLDAVYDASKKQYRGSIVRLTQNTAYELKLVDKSGKTLQQGSFTTWADKVKIAKTIELDPEKITDTLVITAAGKPDGWIRYTQKPGTVIAPKFKKTVIKLDKAKYIILDGLTIKGGYKHVIEVNKCDNVRIANCELSGWGIVGEQRCDYNGRFHLIGKKPSGYGINFNGAINILRGKGIVVERCYIHDPLNRANSWYYSHPAGPEAVTVLGPEGTVIRYNDFVGSDEHRFNDAVEGSLNFNKDGGLNKDGDIYGNFMIYCSDDNIELDGGQQNLRCFDNRFEGSFCGVSIQGCMVGPSYVYNNIFLNMSDEFGGVGYTLKSCANNKFGPAARSYIFNNTFTGPGVGTNIDIMMDYRNNIWGDLRKISESGKPHVDFANVFEWDTKDPNLHSSTMYGKAKINDVRKADLRLSEKSPFLGKGVEIPNFAEGKNINPGAFLNDKEIPVRPLPVVVAPRQVNFSCRKGEISNDGGKVVVKALCDKFNGKFTIRKNDVFDWFEVTPASGVIKDGNSIELSIRIKPGFEPRYRMYRGAFLVRFEDGLSRPVSVYMDTDFKVKPYPVKEGVYTQYIDLTKPTGGKKYPVVNDPDGGNGKVISFKTKSYPILPKVFGGTDADLAEYEFEIPKDGEYMIMIRGKNQNNLPFGNGWFVSLDGSPVVYESMGNLFSPENRMAWAFIKLPQSSKKVRECKVVKLTAGKHVLRVAPRKPVYLDSLCITTDPRIFEDR